MLIVELWIAGTSPAMTGGGDCFVATLLAMTVGGEKCGAGGGG